MRATLIAYDTTAERSAFAESVRDREFVRELRNRNVSYYWGRATIVNDHPDKVATSADKTDTHLAPQLREVVDATKRELFLVSPYFVPGKKGVELLAGVHRRGVRVVLITNSLASTDGVAVHSKYQLYRKPLLQAGIELYEMKPTAGALQERRSDSFRGPTGSSGAGLHAKTFTFDRRIGFIGSYNLDPRSSKLNTEMGVLFNCPALAKRLPENTQRDLIRNAYRVELDRNRLVWVTREGDKQVSYTSEPRGRSLEANKGPGVELATDRGSALSLLPNRHFDFMRQLLVSALAVLLTGAIAFGFDSQTKAEIDELIAFVRTSDVRFIRNGSEYSAAEGADHLAVKLARAGDRVKTTDDFINGIASKSYLSGKPYLVKFADGRTQPTGDWLRAHLGRDAEEQALKVDFVAGALSLWASGAFHEFPQLVFLVLGERGLQHVAFSGKRLESFENLVGRCFAHEHEERGTAGGKGRAQVLHELIVDADVRQLAGKSTRACTYGRTQ